MNRTIVRCLAALGLVISAASAAADSEATADIDAPQVHHRAQVDALVEMLPSLVAASFRGSDLPSLSIAVVYDREIVYSQAFGFADLEQRTPATVATVYPIASITKVFTATILVKLAEEGVVTLDTPVRKYLPEYGVKSPYQGTRPTTLRQLAMHTSGLPRDANINFWSDYAAMNWLLSGGKTEMQWYAPTEKVLETLPEMALEYRPNSRYLYSNLGMTLLGVALERAAGTSFEDYIRSEVLAPLGMSDTGFRSDVSQRADLARGYVSVAPGSDPVLAPEWELESAQFSGGLYSTAEDMCRFLSLQFQTDAPGGGQIVSADGLRMMHLESLAWGYVWDRTHKGIEHTGGHLGFHAYVRAYPGLKIGIAALTNSNNPLIDKHPSDDIAKAVLGKLKEAMETQPEFDPNRVDLGDYVGLYMLRGAEAEMRVELREGKLHVRLLQDPSFDHVMDPLSENEFSVGGSPDAWLEFARDDAGIVRSVSFAGYRFEKDGSRDASEPAH